MTKVKIIRTVARAGRFCRFGMARNSHSCSGVNTIASTAAQSSAPKNGHRMQAKASDIAKTSSSRALSSRLRRPVRPLLFCGGIRQLGNLLCGKSAECVTAQAMRGVVFAWGPGCPRIVDGRAKPGHDEDQTGEITEKTKTRDYWMPACAGVTTPSKNEAQKRALAHRIGSGLVGLLGIGLVRAVGVAIAVAIAAIAAVTPAPALLAAAAVMLAIAFMALAVLRATTLAHLPAALPEIAATAAGADVSAALDAIELAAFVI